ncbi:zinc-ribbon domain-containing protein [Epibacterium ulvae]|uniref:zinc-ribbon domain-containing protein n=1 Tax=Epibacterium ulvae TaxID=1156985 RepID=UPI00249118A4|nr:zinc-ribbon domain-containing protein [Epibacterium ulvae]
MRLTCPNCAAQYEVPESVIPPEGRDVQCSNCGDTWFQRPDGIEMVPAEDAPYTESAEHHDDFSQPPVQHENTEPETNTQEAAEPTPVIEAAPHAKDPRTPRGIDAETADILREEAAREARLRAESQANLETQPDLGLAAPPRRITSEPVPEAHRDPVPDTSAQTSLRRDLLPDIEEINSSLRASDQPEETVPSTADLRPAKSGTGFRRGFLMAVLISSLLVLIYSNADQISAQVPQAASLLNKYVVAVDQARLWLDTQVNTYATPPVADE